MEMSLETSIAVTEITLNDIVRHYPLIKPRRHFVQCLALLLAKEGVYQSDIISQIGYSDLFLNSRMALSRTEGRDGQSPALIANIVINAMRSRLAPNLKNAALS